MQRYVQRVKQMIRTVRQQAAGFTRRDWIKAGVMAGCVLTAFGTVITGVYVIAITRDMPLLPQTPLTQTSGIEVYDRQERLIGVIGPKVIRSYEDIPETFLEALLVTEDRDFFTHPGVSMRGILRAALANLMSGDPTRQGGSTITMQTVRMITDDRSPSLKRKIREMAMAWQLDRMQSKENILILYAALCYLGEGQYGIEAASRYYFGIPAIEMNRTQAATLVAMLKAPNSYSRRNPEKLQQRRNLILGMMATHGLMTQAQQQLAVSQPLTWSEHMARDGQTAFFLDYVASELRRRFGNRFLTTCTEVYTTLDLSAQQAAQQAVSTMLPNIDDRLGFPAYASVPFHGRQVYPQAAFVALDVRDNGVLAWVGGRDYAASPFNATGGRPLAMRQPGSAFKTFAYALAMRNGVSPETVLLDGPVTVTDPQEQLWSPGNYDGIYHGPRILKQMMVKSLNSMAVRLINEHEALTPESLAALAKACGITTDLPPHPSLPLGTVEVTPLEMAAAYSVFAREGLQVGAPYTIRRVLDRDGRVLFADHRPGEAAVAALDSISNFYTVDALRAVVTDGTAKRIRSLVSEGDIIGKTGTSSDYRDAWFVGATPQVVCSAWVGFDDNRSMSEPESEQVIVGGNSAALMAGHFWQKYPEALEGRFWAPPSEAVIWFQVNPETGEPDVLNPDAIPVPYVLRTYLPQPSDQPPIARKETDE